MGYLCNVKKQYWISLFQSLIPAYVIERLFWQERGMTVQMVIYCEIIYAVTIFIMEIPSGILADRFGRKKLLVFSYFFAPIEFLLLLFANHFLMFAFVVFLGGLGKAFSSGSENALLYDSLLAEHQQESYEKYSGRILAIEFSATAVACLSGGVLAYYLGFEFNYIVSTFSMLSAFIVSLTLKEAPVIAKEKEPGKLKGSMQYAKQALAAFRSKTLLLLYCVTGAFLGACADYLDEFWQLVLDYVGVPVIFFGLIGTVTYVLRIPGNLLAWKLKERFRYSSIFKIVIVLNSLGYIFIGLTESAFCILPIIIVSLNMGVLDPLISGYLHHHTSSHIRATTESLSSLLLRLLTILIGLIFGYFCSVTSILGGFTFLGVICFSYLIFFHVVKDCCLVKE